MRVTLAHDVEMKRAINFCFNAKNQALLIKLQGKWGGDLHEDSYFKIT
jgi:hypothetical protein